MEVLNNINSRHKWVTWIEAWLYNNQSCIIVDEKLIDYFHCKRGVRLRDPLSSFLYIMAADTLEFFFKKDRQAHVIKGSGSPCIDYRAITNCHYAYDNILFVQVQKEVVQAAWWTMVAFKSIVWHQN